MNDNNAIISKLSDGTLVAFGILGMIAVFAILILFVGGGGVRHVPITFKMIIQITVAFHNIDGETKVVGIPGNNRVNPTLVSRTGTDTAYALTVISQDSNLDTLYINGLNLHTNIRLQSNQRVDREIESHAPSRDQAIKDTDALGGISFNILKDYPQIYYLEELE